MFRGGARDEQRHLLPAEFTGEPINRPSRGHREPQCPNTRVLLLRLGASRHEGTLERRFSEKRGQNNRTLVEGKKILFYVSRDSGQSASGFIHIYF